MEASKGLAEYFKDLRFYANDIGEPLRVLSGDVL